MLKKVGHSDNGGVGDRLSLTVVMIVVMMVMVLMMATLTWLTYCVGGGGDRDDDDDGTYDVRDIGDGGGGDRVCDGGGGGDGTHDGDDHLLHDLHLLLGGCKVFLQTGVLSGTKLKLGNIGEFYR